MTATDQPNVPGTHVTRLRLALSTISVLVPVSALALQPQPVAKHGSCPSGYSQSGSYCAPSAHARYAVPKHGSCPSGYSQSGDYCLASSDTSRLAIPKVGSCPSGYSKSGDYCLSSR